jgi:hypothetical protein
MSGKLSFIYCHSHSVRKHDRKTFLKDQGYSLLLFGFALFAIKILIR